MQVWLRLIAVSLLAQLSPFSSAAEPPTTQHPLLPGIHSPEVRNPHWPSAAHDKLLTGFSPLKCGMQRPPTILTTIDTGGAATYAAFLTDEQNRPFLLVQDACSGESTPKATSPGDTRAATWRSTGNCTATEPTPSA